MNFHMQTLALVLGSLIAAAWLGISLYTAAFRYLEARWLVHPKWLLPSAPVALLAWWWLPWIFYWASRLPVPPVATAP